MGDGSGGADPVRGGLRGLGDAVAEQIGEIIRDGPGVDANRNAVELAQRRLLGFNEELDEALQEWLNADAA